VRNIARLLLRIVCVPADLIGWLFVCLISLLWGYGLRVRHGVLYTELRGKSWPMRTWYRNWGATTFGHAMIFGTSWPGTVVVWNHELVHVEQFEGACIHGLVVTSAVFASTILGVRWTWYVLGGIALLNGALNYFSAGLAALLRGESYYRGNVLEEAAYDATEAHPPTEKT
jgi:hypothetical protein